MAKKRKVKVFRLLIVILILIMIILGLIFVFKGLFFKEEKEIFNIEDLKINEIDYSQAQEFDFDIYSKEYLLIRLNDFKVLYAKGDRNTIYPASLTKVLTMDAVLNICKDLNDTSSLTDSQREKLIEDNASLAYISTNEEYTIEELLYALVLPSGADAAEALDNYCKNKGTTLVDEMNKICKDLKLNSSHFTNTTGLHDDDLYTTLDDYAKIVIDVLQKPVGKQVLKTTTYKLDQYTTFNSTLKSLINKYDDIQVFGGKTGFTDEAGMNIMVLFETDNRSYLLILANAEGSPYILGQRNIEDVKTILENLY